MTATATRVKVKDFAKLCSARDDADSPRRRGTNEWAANFLSVCGISLKKKGACDDATQTIRTRALVAVASSASPSA